MMEKTLTEVPSGWQNREDEWWAHIEGCESCQQFWDPVAKARRAQPKKLPSFAELQAEIAKLRKGAVHEADMLESAWGIIANAGGWREEDVEASPGWKGAAERWRDRYHEWLDDHVNG